MTIFARLFPVVKRQFSTAPKWLQQNVTPTATRTRIIPKLTTFYSSNPHHEDCMNRLEALLNKYIKYPKMSPATLQLQEKPVWITFDDYALIGGGTRLRPVQYRDLISALNELFRIDPQLTNDEIKAELGKFYRKSSLMSNKEKPKVLDEWGRATAVGKRKTSASRVYLVRGQGEILINGTQMNTYFSKLKDRQSVMEPLRVTQTTGKFNVFVTTSGGGPTGQAEASMNAIAKALLVFNPLYKPILRKAGVITRDYRRVERKKPGKRKARKMPTWVKR